MFTICPSRTKISVTMPPSRFWITCTLLEGMALPSPMVTSSSTANLAQTSAETISAAESHTVTRENLGESCKAASVTSGMKSLSAVLPKLCK
ncbi:hypothetical protein D9M71_735280 [compost metagenome]